MFASATAAAGDGGKIYDFLKKSSLLHRIIDSECTKEAADGLKSKEQFSQLVIQYERLVYTICFQLVRSAPAAEDLTQETFLAAYLHRDTMPEGYERQWLGRIAANKAKDYLQSAWNRHTVLPGDEALPPGLAPPAEEEGAWGVPGAGGNRRRHRTASEPYRPVCRMCLLEERSVEETALALGRPVKTVHTQLRRGKAFLRQQLERSESHEVVP